MMKKSLRALSAALSAALALTAFGAMPAAWAAPQEVSLDRAEIVAAMEKANDYWQSNNSAAGGRAFWDRAAYHTGNMEAYFVTGNEAYRSHSTQWAEAKGYMGNTNTWTDPSDWTWGYPTGDSPTTNDVLHGDWQICFQTYIDLYTIERALSEGETSDSAKIDRAKYVMSEQIKKSDDSYWWWCDALYMVPPVFMKMYQLTGNRDYLDKMSTYYRYAMELMYDGEGGIPADESGYTTSARLNDGAYYSDPDNYANLFFRDAGYVYPLNAIYGEKNFWARGNGWVFAGLAKILNDLPTDYVQQGDENGHFTYDTYKKLFVDMAEAIKNCQQEQGHWTQSMLTGSPTSDRNPYGYETSGTAFFTYGIAWGINSGLLGEEYIDTVKKSWDYLSNIAMQSDGRIGYCQRIGSTAGEATTASNAYDFGTGAFLLAAAEMSKLAGGLGGNSENNGDIYPYLLRRMNGSFAFRLDSPHFFVGSVGKIEHLSTADPAAKAVSGEDGAVMLPVSAFENMGYKVETDEKSARISLANDETNTVASSKARSVIVAGSVMDGTFYVNAEETVTSLGYKLWDGGDGLYIISERETPFFDCEAEAVDMLRGMLGAVERYPDRPEQNVEPDDENDPMTKPYGEEIELSYDMVDLNASSYDDEMENPKSNAFDDDSGTCWAAGPSDNSQYGNHHQRHMVINLGKVIPLACVGIQPKSYDDTRVVYYKLSYSLDGVNYTEFFNGESVAGGGVPLYHDAQGRLAQYIRIDTDGSSKNNGWTAISEITAYIDDTRTVTEREEKMVITEDMVRVTPYVDESANPPMNLFDGDTETYWAANSKYQSRVLYVEFNNRPYITKVRIRAKDYDDNRKLIFDLVRYDTGAGMQTYPLKEYSSEYPLMGGQWDEVRRDDYTDGIQIHTRYSLENGITTNYWTSFAELEIYQRVYDVTVTPQETPDPPQPPEPEYTSELSASLCSIDDEASPLAMSFCYTNAPDRAGLVITDETGAEVYAECVPEGDGAAAVKPSANTGAPNKKYTVTLTDAHGTALAEPVTASLYSVLAEDLAANNEAYLDGGAELSPAKINFATDIVTGGGVYLKDGALTDEAALIMDMNDDGTVITLKPFVVKMGIAFANSVKFGSDEADLKTAAAETGYYDVLTINADGSGSLSKSENFDANFGRTAGSFSIEKQLEFSEAESVEAKGE